MFTGTYKMAERIIRINSIFERVHKYCRDYACEGEPDITVTVAQSDIDYERERSKQEHEFEGLRYPEFSEQELELTAVYRKIAQQMVGYDTFVFHGSVIAVDGQGFLFTAKSGTGKSTHTRLWREYFGDRAVMVNDDKPLLRVTDNGVIAYGTPYCGKHHLGTNIAVPLRAICILERAGENRIGRITKTQAYAMLLQQVYRPQDPVLLSKTLRLVDKMAEHTGLYRLGCNMDISAAEVAYNGMKG